MTIYNDCYDTTVGSAVPTKPIEIAIKEAIIKDGLAHRNYRIRDVGSIKPILITGSSDSETQIPLFAHPITIKNSHSEQYMCADARFFVRKDTPLDIIEKSIKNSTEFNLTVSRLVLSMLWQDNQTQRLKNGLQFAGIVYAAWLSESISKNFALDYKDQTVLNVLTHFFYQTLFIQEEALDQDMRDRIAAQTIKATKVPAEFVMSVIDKAGSMTNIEQYCLAVSNVLENIRLKSFNTAVLLTIVKNSWYGTNGKEIIAVALEHPPTWIAVVWAATNERTFSNSLIARLCDRFGKRGAADEFNSAYRSIINEHIEQASN